MLWQFKCCVHAAKWLGCYREWLLFPINKAQPNKLVIRWVDGVPVKYHWPVDMQNASVQAFCHAQFFASPLNHLHLSILWCDTIQGDATDNHMDQKNGKQSTCNFTLGFHIMHAQRETCPKDPEGKIICRQVAKQNSRNKVEIAMEEEDEEIMNYVEKLHQSHAKLVSSRSNQKLSFHPNLSPTTWFVTTCDCHERTFVAHAGHGTRPWHHGERWLSTQKNELSIQDVAHHARRSLVLADLRWAEASQRQIMWHWSNIRVLQ